MSLSINPDSLFRNDRSRGQALIRSPYLSPASKLATHVNKSVIEIQKERRQYEDEARILANRIALLRQESEKTMKKASETHNKALEVYRKKMELEEYQQKVSCMHFQPFNFIDLPPT